VMRLSHVGSFFFFKQKTAYEMVLRDWSSDVCSSDLALSRAGATRDLAASMRCLAVVVGARGGAPHQSG